MIYDFSQFYGLAGLSWELLQLHAMSAEGTHLAAFGWEPGWELGWGWTIHDDFPLWCPTVAVAEMAGGLAGPLSPAGFPLIHDDFIQSFISCLDVWLFAPNLSSPFKFKFHTATEVTILKSQCFHVLNTTISWLEPPAALCSDFYQNHQHTALSFTCLHVQERLSQASLYTQGLTLPDLK